MSDDEVNTLARGLLRLSSTRRDRHDIRDALFCLGIYAQKNCGPKTWWIRLEAVMMSVVDP